MKFCPDERVLVSPRHLAGTGDCVADVLGPLIHLFNWRHTRDESAGCITVDSPDGSIVIDFTPTTFEGVWWTIARHEPFWRITATQQTPMEVLAGVTPLLPLLLTNIRHPDRIGLSDYTVAELARLYDWTTADNASGVSFTSPDGHCTVRHTPGTEQPWYAEHSVRDGVGTRWHVAFEGEVPDALARQFFLYLATDVPVERTLEDIPRLARGQAQMTPLGGKPPSGALGPQLSHVLGGIVDAVEKGRRR
ncbi:DUF317 domain-containing protein [Streptomyces sp. NPDC058861]|uniref:DUF317 domain-containing protein n=1 Tax=Streptomyces sp. NPDC058861 TaxID=3346653 RepID=UPI0036CEF924